MADPPDGLDMRRLQLYPHPFYLYPMHFSMTNSYRSSAETPFPFFRLPRELRDKIYAHLTKTTKIGFKHIVARHLYSAELTLAPLPGALSICKQFSKEYEDTLRRLKPERQLRLDFRRRLVHNGRRETWSGDMGYDAGLFRAVCEFVECVTVTFDLIPDMRKYPSSVPRLRTRTPLKSSARMVFDMLEPLIRSTGRMQRVQLTGRLYQPSSYDQLAKGVASCFSLASQLEHCSPAYSPAVSTFILSRSVEIVSVPQVQTGSSADDQFAQFVREHRNNWVKYRASYYDTSGESHDFVLEPVAEANINVATFEDMLNEFEAAFQDFRQRRLRLADLNSVAEFGKEKVLALAPVMPGMMGYANRGRMASNGQFAAMGAMGRPGWYADWNN